jgi:RNA polymerase sigma factor (sigma-70 family)
MRTVQARPGDGDDGSGRRGADDERLVLAGRAGDPTAFPALFERWFDPCVDVAWRILHDRDAAADVGQETFLAAWRELDRLRQPSSFGGWVLRTARNRALNRLARDRRSVTMGEDQVTAALDGQPRPDEAAAVVERDEDAELVWAAATALGERDASLLDLHVRHGLTVPEIAEALDVTANNAHQLLYRLKGKLGGAMRAWVLWRRGDPACPDLRGVVEASGVVRFGAEAVRVIDGHARDCMDCDERQRLRLAPEILFAAMPIVPTSAALRARAVAALEAEGVPMGTAPGTSPGRAGEDSGPAEPGAGEDGSPGAGDGPGTGSGEDSGPAEPGAGEDGSPGAGDGPGTGSGPAGDGTGTRARRRAVTAGVAAAVVLTAAVMVAAVVGGGGDDQATRAAGTGGATADTADGGEPSPAPSPSTTTTSIPATSTTEPSGTTGTGPGDPGGGTDPAGEGGGTGDPPPPPTDPVPGPPEITGFGATASVGSPCPSTGSRITLVWTATGGDRAALSGAGAPTGELPASGQATACIASGRPGTYTLTVSGPGGTDTATATPEPAG